MFRTRMRDVLCLSTAVFVLVLVGCGTDGSPAVSPATSAPVVAVSYDHLPGTADVSTMTPGQPFEARPNFHYFVACGRPCYMPLYPQAEIIKGTAETSGWPCEARDTMSPGDFCNDANIIGGDWVHVVCQVAGAVVQNEHMLAPGRYEQSAVYDAINVEPNQIKPGMDRSKLKKLTDGTYLLYAPDIWFGDTSRDPVTHEATLAVHKLPC